MTDPVVATSVSTTVVEDTTVSVLPVILLDTTLVAVALIVLVTVVTGRDISIEQAADAAARSLDAMVCLFLSCKTPGTSVGPTIRVVGTNVAGGATKHVLPDTAPAPKAAAVHVIGPLVYVDVSDVVPPKANP